MIDEGLRLVFRTMQNFEVSCLLMGGQACVLYGAAEFSKDVDFAILAEPDNLDRVDQAVRSLNAEVIAIPPFEARFLDEGLAIHFRCHAPHVDGLRIDVMTKMRGVASFPQLWERRNEIGNGADRIVNLLHIEDLVTSKKTQRDKDWPMIQRLMEVNYLAGVATPSPEGIAFWFRELRSSEFLIDAAGRFPGEANAATENRSLIVRAIESDRAALERELNEEMLAEKELDRIHWEPLKARLSELRRSRNRS